jgi:hypothetical protein
MDLEAFERRRGISFAPWQADLLVEMSKAYMAEAATARQHDAKPPTKEAAAMWRHVRNTLAERSWDKVKPLEEKRNVHRK